MENIIEEIKRLKEERNAVILCHFYQPAEIQDIADYVGDSFELSKIASSTDAEVIVFCGVYFMAESAKILSPDKTVLIPNKAAGCPMADMVKPEDIIKLRKEHPNAAVVTYINSTAAVKAECDICCTSSNAVKVVNSLPNEEIIFVPDKNLGSYVARFTDKKMILFEGYCPVHHRTTAKDVAAAKALHPDAPVLVHPECPAEVIDSADFTGSTAKIIEYVTNSDKKEFIIGTEKSIIHPLKKKNPDKNFYVLTDNFVCPNMKKITLQHILTSLETDEHNVELGQKVIEKAASSLFRMLAVK